MCLLFADLILLVMLYGSFWIVISIIIKVKLPFHMYVPPITLHIDLQCTSLSGQQDVL